MREIKYKVWDKKHEVMLEPIELTKLLSYLLFQKMPNSTVYDMMKDQNDQDVWLLPEQTLKPRLCGLLKA